MKEKLFLLFTLLVTGLSLTMYLTNAKAENIPKGFESVKGKEVIYVELNSASLDDLMKITGIGEKKANDILEFRRKKGIIKRTDDLLEIKGIKENTLNKIIPYIYVADENK